MRFFVVGKICVNNKTVPTGGLSMPKTTMTQEERQLVKLVEKLPVADEDKNNWLERIRSGEMSQEVADEIRKKLSPVEGENEQKVASRTRYLTELTMLVNRWRLSSQSRNFQRNR
jgi:hypothetical protein